MFSLDEISTPSYVVDKKRLEQNLKLFQHIQECTGAKILLSQKAFSTYYFYPLIGKYLSGASASGLYEARLGFEEMKEKEVHVYSPAYKECEIKELISISDYIVFNTPEQWMKYKKEIIRASKKNGCGIRINPEYSEINKDKYNPCAKFSRLGTTLEQLNKYGDFLFDSDDGYNLDGVLFHTLCEQNVDTLKRVLVIIEKNFQKYLKKIKWINFGGGHYITHEDYDVDGLIHILKQFKESYDVQIYMEPGEAIALHCGYLVCTVLDIVKNGIEIAIVDTSATCHMPNILEVPFQPLIKGAGKVNEKKYNYRIGGISCLAGDIIGDYSFEQKLNVGDKLILDDMIVYSMVKNNTFNGIPLPNIAVEDNGIHLIKSFTYEDYKKRL